MSSRCVIAKPILQRLDKISYTVQQVLKLRLGYLYLFHSSYPMLAEPNCRLRFSKGQAHHIRPAEQSGREYDCRKPYDRLQIRGSDGLSSTRSDRGKIKNQSPSQDR